MRASVEKSFAPRSAALTPSLGIFLAAAPALAQLWQHHGFDGGFFAGALGSCLLGGMIASRQGDNRA